MEWALGLQYAIIGGALGTGLVGAFLYTPITGLGYSPYATGAILALASVGGGILAAGAYVKVMDPYRY